jgi:hypothetical protein
MKEYIKIVSVISFVAVVVGLIIWRIDRKSEFQQEAGGRRLKNAKIEAPGKIGNMKVDFNGTVTDVTLSLDDLDGGVDLVKWTWPAGLPKEPMWFRAFQAMSDPRKFDTFDDYRNFTTREWREETKTDRPEDFDRWKQEAVLGSEVHDAKKVTINRVVFVKILDMEYVF